MENNKMEKNIIKKIAKVDNLFEFPSSENMQITFDNSYIEEPFQKELKDRVQLLKDIEKSPNKEKINDIFNSVFSTYAYEKYLFKIYTGKFEYDIVYLNDLTKNNDKIKKYENIYFSSEYDEFTKYNRYKNQIKNIQISQYFEIKNIFEFILFCYKHLNKNGSVYFRISIPNINIINALYFLTLIFDNVYIINKFGIFCKSFKNDKEYLKLINEIKKHNYKFSFNEKKNEKKLIKYFKTLFKIDYYYKKKMIYNQEYNNYIVFKFIFNYYDIFLLDKLYLKQTNYKKNLTNIYVKSLKNINTSIFIINEDNENEENLYLNELYKKNIDYKKKINSYKKLFKSYKK